MVIKILTVSLRLKGSTAKWRPFCLCLEGLTNKHLGKVIMDLSVTSWNAVLWNFAVLSHQQISSYWLWKIVQFNAFGPCAACWAKARSCLLAFGRDYQIHCKRCVMFVSWETLAHNNNLYKKQTLYTFSQLQQTGPYYVCGCVAVCTMWAVPLATPQKPALLWVSFIWHFRGERSLLSFHSMVTLEKWGTGNHGPNELHMEPCMVSV